MGRTANADQPFYFNAVKFNNDIKQAVARANRKIRTLVYTKVKANAEGLPMKSNRVLTAEGTTSDAQRKGALLASIAEESLGWQAAQISSALLELPSKMNTNTSYISEVSAMKKGDYKDTHVGNYYEYGTGEKENVARIKATGINLGDRNPFREPASNAPVVSRPLSTWTDMGGNIRKSYGKGGVTRASKGFNNYVGDDIEAFSWFKDAYEEVRTSGKVKEAYQEELSKVYSNFSKGNNPYLKVKKKIVLGAKK